MLIDDYLAATREGKSALIIAPTHAEGDRLTEALRIQLKARGSLGARERSFITRAATGWSDAQKSDVRNFRAGMLVAFHQAVAGRRTSSGGKRSTTGGFAKGEVAAVVGRDEQRVVLMRQDGSRAFLPEGHAQRFQVYVT